MTPVAAKFLYKNEGKTLKTEEVQITLLFIAVTKR